MTLALSQFFDLRHFLLMGSAILWAAPTASWGATPYVIGPKPAWVSTVHFLEKNRRQATQGDFARFFLSDVQVDLTQGEARYHRFAIRALNNAGIEQLSRLKIAYRPENELLTLHDIALLRQGKRLSILKQTRLRMETQAASPHLLLEIDGLRPDDVVDYHYTLQPRRQSSEPFDALFPLQWAEPVDRAHIRIVFDSAHPVQHRVLQSQNHPKLQSVGSRQELSLMLDNIPALRSEDRVPANYLAVPLLQISQYAAWDKVLDKLRVNRQQTVLQSTAWQPFVSNWLRQFLAPEQRARAALDFVQKEIKTIPGNIDRSPVPLDSLMATRAATPRDKAVLLSALLNQMSIDAAPALVSTKHQSGLKQFLPSLGLLDHALVLVYLDGTPHWLDPSNAYQSGPLSERSTTHYGIGLVMDDSAGGLTQMAPTPDYRQEVAVTQRFSIADYRQPAQLDIETEYWGRLAEHLRESLSATALTRRDDQRLLALRRFYPAAQVVETPRWVSDPHHNRVRIIERYLIPDLLDYADGYFVSHYFAATDILTGIGFPDKTTRVAPYGLTLPFRFTQHTEVHLPPPLQEREPVVYEISNPYVRYQTRRGSRDQALLIFHRIENLQAAVSPEGFTHYVQDMQKIRGLLAYTWVQTVASKEAIAHHLSALPASAPNSVDPSNLRQDMARIRAAIDSGNLNEKQKARASKQLETLETQWQGINGALIVPETQRQ